jgi:ubiquitin C-terminal hydrolase
MPEPLPASPQRKLNISPKTTPPKTPPLKSIVNQIKQKKQETKDKPRSDPCHVTPPMMDHEYCLSPKAKKDTPTERDSHIVPPMSKTGPLHHRFVTAGLKNRGFYCYMNSILQCLSNIPKLKEWFDNSRLPTKVPLASEYQKLITLMWTTGDNFVDPDPFIDTLVIYDFPFPENKQQDSSEFLVWFLNALHQDLSLKKDVDRKSLTSTSLHTSQVSHG